MLIKHFGLSTPRTTPSHEIEDPLSSLTVLQVASDEFDPSLRALLLPEGLDTSSKFDVSGYRMSRNLDTGTASVLIVFREQDVFVLDKTLPRFADTIDWDLHAQGQATDTNGNWTLNRQISAKQLTVSLSANITPAILSIGDEEVQLELFCSSTSTTKTLYQLLTNIKEQHRALSASTSTSSLEAKVPSLSRSATDQELFSVRQIVRAPDGRIVSGTITGLCRQILLDKVEYTDITSFSFNLLRTIGLWGPPNEVLSELLKHMATLADSATKGKPARLIRIFIEHSSSHFLDKVFVEQLLSLAQFADDSVESTGLKELIGDHAASVRAALPAQTQIDTTEVSADSPWAAEFATLTRDGFHADAVLSLPTAVIANQLQCFHLEYLRHCPPATDRSLFFRLPESKINSHPLVFGTGVSHFLSHTILSHVLCMHSGQVSSEQRAAICAQWIRIGIHLRRAGDMTGWMAIALAICSSPITRLKEMWTLLDTRLRTIVQKEWSPVVKELHRYNSLDSPSLVSAHVLASENSATSTANQNIVPFYGDLVNATERYRQNVQVQEHGHICVSLDVVERAYCTLTTALDSFEAFAKQTATKSDEATGPALLPVKVFQDLFRELMHSAQNLPKDIKEQYAQSSMACEPPRVDDVVSRKHNPSVPTTGCFVPLVFTEVLPSYRLFEASDLLSLGDTARRHKTTMSQIPETGSFQTTTNLRRLNSFPPTQRPSTYTTGNDTLDMNTRKRTAASVSEWKMLKHLKDITGVSDVLIPYVGGQLLLKDCTSDLDRKRPQSIIVDRKRDSTVSRRSSIQIPDNWNVENEEEHQNARATPSISRRRNVRHTVIRAATINVLVDLLLLPLEDLKYLAAQAPGSTPNNIYLDRSEFLTSFLASYRAYCEPSWLMAAIVHRITRMPMSSTKSETARADFPRWAESVEACSIEATYIDWSLTDKIYAGLFECLNTWIYVAPGDFIGSTTMIDVLQDLLTIAGRQLLSLKSQTEGTEPEKLITQSMSTLGKISRQALRLRHTPNSWRLPDVFGQWEVFQIKALSEIRTTADAEIALRQLNRVVESVLQAVTLEDWMRSYDLLEIQSTYPGAFFSSLRELLVLDQDVVIQDCVRVLEATKFADTETPLARLLPFSIKSLMHLKSSISQWLLSEIVNQHITCEQRVERITMALQIMSLSGRHMDPFNITVTTEPDTQVVQTVPSFIASALASALTSPESRLFSLAWSLVAQKSINSDTATTLVELLPDTSATPLQSATIVPCAAWLCERLLEIACYVPDVSSGNPELLNFDKKRYIYNLIVNLDLVGPFTEHIDILSEIENPFLFLLDGFSATIDAKALRGAASKENSARTTRIVRPFSQLVTAEHEKIRRDLKHRENYDRNQKEIQKALLRKQQDLSRSLENSKRASMRSKYGMNSLLRAVRPLSVAISSSWTPEKGTMSSRVVAPEELPAQCIISKNARPALTIDLVNAVVGVLNRSENLFRIRTEDGMETYFQAPSAEELEQWIKVMSLAAIDGANKRRTIIREDAKLASVEEIPQFSPRNSMVLNFETAVFGIDLAVLVRREKASIPHCANQLMDEIEQRGLEEVGIYRISGSLTTVNALKAAFNGKDEVDLRDDRWADINAIAGVFKLWLRELPEPLMTYDLYSRFLATLDIEDYTQKSLALKELVHQLPVPNFSMLKRLIEHLQKVTDYEATNHMYAHNLAIVFGPNILQPTPSLMSLTSSMNDLGKVQTLIRNLILQCHWIFTVDEEAETKLNEIDQATPRVVEEVYPSLQNLTTIPKIEEENEEEEQAERM